MGPFSSKYIASLPDFPEKATRTLALGRKKGTLATLNMHRDSNLQMACHIFSCQTRNIHQFKDSLRYSLCKGRKEAN